MRHKNWLPVTILFLVLLSFATADWDIVHAGGLSTLHQMLQGMSHPNFTLLPSALNAAWITTVYATTGLSIAIIFAIVLGLLASGIYGQRLMGLGSRILGLMRGIHELIWAFFFVAAIGMQPMAAIMAIAIPYGGMLGKVYANIFRTVDPHKIKNLEQSGLSKLQIVSYGIFPLAYKNMVSYTIYRFECALRSSSILGFVGLAGLGLKITFALSDLDYSAAFMYIYLLGIIVILVDLWGNIHRRYKTQDTYSGKILGFLTLSTWTYVILVEGIFSKGVFTSKNLTYTLNFIKGLLGMTTDQPAFLQRAELKDVLSLSVDTMQMSIIAITLSAIFMILTIIPASRQYSTKPLYFLTRGIYLIFRAIPELIWAMMIIYILKPGIISGAIALAIHNSGILAKLCSEVVEDLEEAPLQNLMQMGMSKVQILIYGVLPMAYQKIVHYIIYRWEVILRTTIIVGFIGAGGLGYYFKLHMSLFHYSHITLVMIAYLVMVKISDLISEKLLYKHSA